MATINQRITALEKRRTHAEAWPELIILHGNESMTAHQLSECQRAAKHSLPTLTVIIRRANNGNA